MVAVVKNSLTTALDMRDGKLRSFTSPFKTRVGLWLSVHPLADFYPHRLPSQEKQSDE